MVYALSNVDESSRTGFVFNGKKGGRFAESKMQNQLFFPFPVIKKALDYFHSQLLKAKRLLGVRYSVSSSSLSVLQKLSRFWVALRRSIKTLK